MSRVKTVMAAAVPEVWKTWRSRRNDLPQIVTPDIQSGSERPGRPLQIDTGARLSSPGSSSSHPYGYAVYASNPNSGRSGSGPSSLRSSPDRHRRDSILNRVPEESATPEVEDEAVSPDEDDEEEEEEELEEELEEQGLYKGSYTRLLALYTLVPLFSLLLLLLIALLPPLIWRLPSQTHPSPLMPPFPLSELLTSISLWSLSHIIRVPLYTFFSILTPRSDVTSTLLSTFTHVTTTNVLRLSAIVILNIRHTMNYPFPTDRDPSFQRVIWLAIGWSVAEVVGGVTQGYEHITLYKEVLVPEGRTVEFLRALKNGGGSVNVSASALWDSSGIWTRSSAYSEEREHDSSQATIKRDRASNGEEWNGPVSPRYLGRNGDATIQLQVEKDLDQLLSLKAREEVEEVYGIPAIKIPVFISGLQRVNSIVLSQGLNLLLSAGYLSSRISQPRGSETLQSNYPFTITFPVVVVVHLLLSVLHTPIVLPKIGLHTASYVGLLVSLGCLFAGLAVWGALS